MGKTKLRNPDITNVDLVDRPANQGAKVMLFKRDGDEPIPPEKDESSNLFRIIAKKLGITKEEIEKSGEEVAETFDEALTEKLSYRVTEDMWEYTSALQDSIRSIIQDPEATDKVSLINASLGQFTSAMMAVVPNWLNKGYINKVGRTLSEASLTRLRAMLQSLQTLINDTEKPKGDESKMEDTKKRSDEDQKLITDLEAEIADLKKAAAPPPTEEDVLKSLDPAVRKVFDDLKARADAAENVAKKALDDEKTKSFIAKAAGYTHLGITSEEFGPILKSIAEKVPEASEKIEAVLKAADEAVAKGGLFSEAGSSRQGVGKGSQVSWSKIQEAAKGFVAKSGKNMSEAEGVTKFLETPDGEALYAEYVKEKGEN